jgi:hypothetical protein
MKTARHPNEDVSGLFGGMDVIKMKTSLLTRVRGELRMMPPSPNGTPRCLISIANEMMDGTGSASSQQ